MARWWTLLAALIATGLFAAAPARAQTDNGSDGSYDVNSNADNPDANTGDGVCDDAASPEDGDCTLRAAVQQATATDAVDVVNVPADDYLLDSSNGELNVDDDILTINGAGQDTTVVDGQSETRILRVADDANVTVNGFTFLGGFHSSRAGGVKVRNPDSVFTMNDSTIGNNHTDGEGGGVYVQGGTATLNRVTVDGNTAREGAGLGVGDTITQPTLVLNDSRVNDNIASENGGGIYNDSDGQEEDGDPAGLQVNGGSITRNRAEINGGGIWNVGEAAVQGTRISDNTADSNADGAGDGGGVYNASFFEDVAVAFEQEFTGGQMTINRSLIAGNLSLDDNGGGVANQAGAEITIDETAIRDNGAGDSGEAKVLEPGAAGGGGGIFNHGLAHVTNSEISGNGGTKQGQRDEGLSLQPYEVVTAKGGGILNATTLERIEQPLIEVRNTTISGNSAIEGGGVYNARGETESIIPPPAVRQQEPQERLRPTAHLRYVTLANNQALDGTGGGIFNEEGIDIPDQQFAPPGLVTLEGTLIAANREGGPENCGGLDPESAGNNLEDADTCDLNSSGGDGDIVNGNPGIAGLADNGGPPIAGGGTTHTHALLDGSQALDGVSVAAAAFSQAERQGCPPRDQRNISRPQGPACDIGAYERLIQQVPPAENERPGVTTSGPRACVSRRSFLLRVNVTGLTRERVQRVDVFLDGRRIARRTQAQFTVRVRVSRLSRRRTHRIRVVATDESGDQASQTRRFRRCARPAFTG